MEKILTVPTAVAEETVFVTGNHHVSLPHISAHGHVLALSHLSRAGNALVEYTGKPLFCLALNGEVLQAADAEYLHSFIPTFKAGTKDIAVEWNFFAPEGIRGFVVHAQLCTQATQTASLSLQFTPGQLLRGLFHSRPLKTDSAFGVDEWTGAAAAEYTAGFGISALAISGRQGFSATAEKGRLFVEQKTELAANTPVTLEFYVALGAEQDGACLTNMDMRRRAGALYRKHTQMLEKRKIPIPDPILEQRVNLNLNFCYYFSMGMPLDSDDWMLMTSKSNRYYVSGAYWARDCFLWAFPAILRVDTAMAKQALLAGFTTYLKQGANHALYLNGANLYPGFELDELVAPLIALQRYVEHTGDEGILLLSQIKHGAEYIAGQLVHWHDEETGLYRTELNPSDDPVGAPCLVYNNALVLAALRFCDGRLLNAKAQVAALENALAKHATLQTENGPLYVWAVGGGKAPEVYDDPPGSLLLMPYYGWPSKDDETYKNTVAHFFSAKNEYFWQQGDVMGQGCEHAPAPWPMSLCNLLLAGGHKKEDLLGALRAMPMDNGIACETVWPETGKVNTGAAFATFAGFYANAIIEAYGCENES